jgi:hypothetical protein
MKKLLLLVLFLTASAKIQLASAQTAELQQLALDIEKLIQLKKILTDMKTGFDIVSKGYGTIRNLTEGNFNLHETILNGLLVVNPRLRKYQRVADIIRYQADLIKEYKSAFREFKSSAIFTPEEITYLGSVYDDLFNRSLQNLDELTLVLTDSRLRMSDDERLTAIDRIYKEMQDKLSFLQNFDQRTRALEEQRTRLKQDATEMKQLYNLNN